MIENNLMKLNSHLHNYANDTKINRNWSLDKEIPKFNRHFHNKPLIRRITLSKQQKSKPL